MPKAKYNNPIIPGFNPDPSICRVGEDYYLITSSFEFFPGVPIYHSKDLINWKHINYCLTRQSQLMLHNAPASGGIWAPTIRYHNGTFYMTTTNKADQGNFYVTTTDPAGDWSEPIWVEQGGIDPSLFFDDDGKVYYTTNEKVDGKSGISQSEIDIKTGKRLTPVKHIWSGTGGSAPEAPHLYKINGVYYLMIAEGGTEYGHMVTIARSKSPWGSFESCPRNPVLTHRDRKGYPIQGTGHADLVQAHDGSWWAVFLGFRYTRKYFHHLGRETFLVPVTFDEDVWPVFNENGTVDLEMEADCLPFHSMKEPELKDDFDEDKLKIYWNFLRNPYENTWSLSERKGYLTLYGSEITLDQADSPTFIGRRQQHFDCTAQTLIEFNPSADNEEAGMTIYLNNEHHYDFFITKSAGVREVQVRRVVGDMSYIAYKKPVDDGPVILDITADMYEYTFSFGYDKESLQTLGTARTQFVSTEAGVLGFTGVYFGLYASGNGKKCTAPAYFDWFDYQVEE